MLTAVNEMDYCFNSSTLKGEQSDPSNVFVCVLLSVIFAVAIILLSPFYSFAVYPRYQRGTSVLTASFQSKLVKPHVERQLHGFTSSV